MQNLKFHWMGAGILALNKIRHTVRGYRTPRPFSVSDVDRAIDYDLSVVERFRAALNAYAGREVSFRDWRIAELGPGADLGVGLLLLAAGARSYAALDVHDLVSQAPEELYEGLFRRLESAPDANPDVRTLREQLDCWRSGSPQRLDYIVDPRFDVRRLAERGIDLVLSNAAFEHFDDVPRVASDLARAVEPECVLVAEIDLQTHSRWIRDADPLNIYRYSDPMYGAGKFKGSPNRLRPPDYVRAFERAGWREIQVKPLTVLDEAALASVQPSLNARFRTPECRMEILSFVLCARRGG